MFLLGLSVLLHLYIGARLVPALPTAAAVATALLLAFSALLVPAGLVARRLAAPPMADRLAWVGLSFLGLFSSLLVLTLLRELVLVIAWLAGAPAQLAAWSAIATVVLALAATALGFWNARRTPGVVRVRIPVDTLPAALEGFRIVQISDIHVGPTIRRGKLEAIVQAVNRLQPDAVAITGDLVDGTVPELRDHVAPLAALRARHGSFFVTGNHEYYAGVQPWLHELRRLGLRVLLNAHEVLDHDGEDLVIAGVPDHGAGHFDPSHKPDPHAALHGAPVDAVRVLLAHQPRSIPGAAAAGFHVQLSGHTHGGQFLPWNFFVRLQQPYTAGLHRHGPTWLYVSRGTGYWGPPKRFGAPAEITEIQLVRSPRRAG